MNARCAGVALCLALSFAALVAADDAKKPSLLSGTTLVKPQIPESVVGRMRRLNEELSRDLEPVSNSAVYFVEMYGPVVFEPELREASLTMLGISALSPEVPRMVSPEAYARSASAVDGGPFQARAAKLYAQMQVGIERIWSPKELTDLATFLETNAAALDSAADIVALKRYYVPFLSNEAPPRITSAALGVEMRLTGLAQLLTARATRQSSDGNLKVSVGDLLTCHRLAVLLAEGSPFDISHSKAHLIDAYACQGAFHLLKAGKLQAASAREYLRQFDAMPRLPTAAMTADLGERAILEQELEVLEHDQSTVREYLEIAKEKRLVNLEETRLADVNWKLALQRATEIQDRVVAALKIDAHRPQEERFAELDRAYEAWMRKSDELVKPTEGTVEMNLDEMSRWIGETVAMSNRANCWQRRATDDRAQVRQGIMRIGLALAAYAGDRGSYPESLKELAPRYIDKVPNEAHSESPFQYERRADGSAVVSSWGRNRENDAGKFYNDDKVLELAKPPARP